MQPTPESQYFRFIENQAFLQSYDSAKRLPTSSRLLGNTRLRVSQCGRLEKLPSTLSTL